MKESDILKRLDQLSRWATERMNREDLTTLPNHTTIDFLTDQERAERHRLLLMLPSSGQKIQEAKHRIADRISRRRRNN